MREMCVCVKDRVRACVCDIVVGDKVVCVCESCVCERVVSDKAVCHKVACERDMCERLCVTKLCVTKSYLREMDSLAEWMCQAKETSISPSATPAMQMECRCRQVPRLPRKVPWRHGRLTAPKRTTRANPVS